MSDVSEDIAAAKALMRETALAARAAQVGKEANSERIWERVLAAPEYASSDLIVGYVHARSEVRTWGLLEKLLADGKRVAVPYCRGDELHPVEILALSELAPGTFGIPEPVEAIRRQRDRQVQVEEAGMVLVPGVAFDRRGRRLGHGYGYYDRLLSRFPSKRPLLAGLAYECQLVAEVPVSTHDVTLDSVITESNVYVCQQVG